MGEQKMRWDVRFARHVNSESMAALAKRADLDLCDPRRDRRILRGMRRQTKYNEYFLALDLIQYGKTVLTPAEVVRYKLVVPPKAHVQDVGDPSDERASGDDFSEEDAIEPLVGLGLEVIDEILPSDGITPATDTGWITTAAPGVGRLPAMVSDQPVDWRPKVRATVAIPFADYPVAPPAAQGRHWSTKFDKPLVTGREAETGKPIVQFLRAVNTRASRKTELLRLLLHNARAVLSKGEFERILDLEHKPYLKWFLTVKHPMGAPEEYLQELRDLDDWRSGCVWACGLGAVLLALLGLAGGVSIYVNLRAARAA
eukprot:g19811.t1